MRRLSALTPNVFHVGLLSLTGSNRVVNQKYSVDLRVREFGQIWYGMALANVSAGDLESALQNRPDWLDQRKYWGKTKKAGEAGPRLFLLTSVAVQFRFQISAPPGGLEPPTHGLTVPRISPFCVEKHSVCEKCSADRGHNRGHFSEKVRELLTLFLTVPPNQQDLILSLARNLAPAVPSNVP